VYFLANFPRHRIAARWRFWRNPRGHGLAARGAFERSASDLEASRMESESLLYSEVAQASLKQFRDGHYKDAVLNGIIAAFDLLQADIGIYHQTGSLC